VAKKHKKHEHVNHERWLVSYADFITLLFAFFVVMFAVSQVDSNKVGRFTESLNVAFHTDGIFPPSSGSPLERGGSAGAAIVPAIVADRPSLFRYAAASPRAQAVKESLEESIDAAGLGSVVGLRYDERGVVLSLPEHLYFRAGTANLRSEALANLAEVAKAVGAQRGALVVEGHTDDLPVRSPLFPRTGSSRPRAPRASCATWSRTRDSTARASPRSASRTRARSSRTSTRRRAPPIGACRSWS
jgi:chemotaxis protein MotB